MTGNKYAAAVRAALVSIPVSRREIARRAFVSHSTINRIVHGEQPISEDVAKAVAHALRQIAEECEQGATRILNAGAGSHE